MARLKGNRWQADALLDGKRLRPSFDTQEEAEAFEANPGQTPLKPTVGVMFRHGAKLLWTGSKNEVGVNGLTEELIKRLGEHTMISTITTSRVQDLRVELITHGNCLNTINKKMSCLSKLLGFCVDRLAIQAKPKITFSKVQNGRIRFLTPTEVTLILDPMEPDLRHYFYYLLDTGCRRGEALALDWLDVTPHTSTYWRTKGNKPRTIPLTLRAAQAIEHFRGRHPKLVFGGLTKDQLRYAWDKAKAKAGLGDDDQVVPHILRHTCASNLIQRGADLLTVKEWLGHSDIRQTMIYAHLAPNSLFRVVGLLGAVPPGYDPASLGVSHLERIPGAVPNTVPLCQPLTVIPQEKPQYHQGFS